MVVFFSKNDVEHPPLPTILTFCVSSYSHLSSP